MTPDPFTLQIVGNSLVYASEEMGLALRNSSYSPNIKERMDHSAALFDPEGRLLAQAEHIPVHLGSLPWGLNRLLGYCSREGVPLEEGSMVASNDPYLTGTHLNDVTVVAPVHYGRRLVAYVVNKAHHSDVGGRVPGSISMGSRTLLEEGFVLSPTVIWRRRSFADSEVEKFASASRTPAERKGDLRAQVAANVTGARRVRSLIDKYGLETFEQAGAHSFEHSESLTRKRIAGLRPGSYSASDSVEGEEGQDLTIKATVTVSLAGIHVDYAGTSPQVDYPLNAVFGVTVSGAYFVLRCLAGGDIPANHGTFSPLTISCPEGVFLNPTRPHPVGGGNVETSQRNADVLFLALSKAAPGLVPAASGGSMNNVMMGGSNRGQLWAFYETIGVGLGGSSSGDGTDGIQSNMTNTLNTPIEEMERSLPLRLVKYELRPDSSGAGKYRGGSGIIRTYMALASGTTFTILADRGRHAPWGLAGGGRGGRTEVNLRRRGRALRIPVKSTLSLSAGDIVEVRTAGGGGYGRPGSRPKSAIAKDFESGLLSARTAATKYGRAPDHT